MKFFYWLGILPLVFSCKQKEEAIQPVVQPITESVYAAGKVKSKDQYDVYATVSGIVKQIYVTDGSEVKKGDLLMTLVNDIPLLNKENAVLTSEYQSLGANTDKLNEAWANINLYRTKLQNDSLLYERQRRLWSNDIGTKNELEQKELAYKNSATNYQTALLRYQQLKKQVFFADKQSKKAVQISSTVTNDYNIRAQQSGKIFTVNKEPGELVVPQEPVAVLGNADAFLLELQVDEYDISKIRQGQKVFVTMDSYKGKVFEASVTKIRPLMNERNRSITVEATFIEQPPGLLPNLSVEGNVLIRKKENALTIPRNYLVDDSCVLLRNGEKRKVAIGLKDYQWAEIVTGLDRGDFIKKPVE